MSTSKKNSPSAPPSGGDVAQTPGATFRKRKRRPLVAALASMAALVAIGAAITLHPKGQELAWLDPIRSAFAIAEYDPFEEHAWHAMGSTWPGTIKFNGKDKTVLLSPMGAPEINGTYSYEIKHASSRNLRAAKLIEGTLRMTNTIGQVSESNFRMEDGSRLLLSYTSGQRPEEYARLSGQDVANQKAQLERMLKEGKVKPFVPPAALMR